MVFPYTLFLTKLAEIMRLISTRKSDPVCVRLGAQFDRVRFVRRTLAITNGLGQIKVLQADKICNVNGSTNLVMKYREVHIGTPSFRNSSEI